MSHCSVSPTMHSPTPYLTCSHSSSHGRSLSCDKLWTCVTSPTGQTTSSGKRQWDHSPSEQRHKHHRCDSPGRWIDHPFLPLVWHKNHCMMCNDYAQHVGISAAMSGNGFRSVVDGLVDCTTVFCGTEPPRGLYAQVDCLCQQCDDLTHDLVVVHEEIACLTQGSISQPILTNDKACQIERAQMASMGVPMSEGQPQAWPSCVTPATHSSMERMQAEPAAPAPPTTTTSSCKGKEWQTSPVPTHTVVLYKDIHMDDSV